MWKKFVDAHNIPNRDSFGPIKMLQYLLQHWVQSGRDNRTYGPYPTPFEQQEFQNIVVVPLGYIAQAITEFKFEPCFKANEMDIQTFI
eukprot:UN03137